MSPILGIWASAQQSSAYAFESIATSNFTTNTAGITFSSIPSTYKHLQIRFMIKSQASTNDFSMYFNNVSSGGLYSFHNLSGNGSSASATAYTTQNYGQLMNDFNTSFPSGSVMSGVIDLLDYQNTNKYKTIRTLLGTDQNGAGFIKLNSAMYQSTSAISQIDFYNGYNWASGSFALYGIRG